MVKGRRQHGLRFYEGSVRLGVDLVDQLILVGTGLCGLMGGLLGIGGSVVMIPIIVHVVGRDQHFAQGAAMLVNVFVAIPAACVTTRGPARMELVQWFAPTTVLFIMCGVWLSNQLRIPNSWGWCLGCSCSPKWSTRW